MAFISNQWLNRGRRLRTRSYKPKQVEVSLSGPSDEWALSHQIRTEIYAEDAEDGMYQVLLLSQDEVDPLAAKLVSEMSPAARELMLVNELTKLSNTKLLRLLAFDLRTRVRLQK